MISKTAPPLDPASPSPMSEFRIKKARPIATEISVPGDKSISHRAIMFAALSNGTCGITGFLPSGDCLSTAAAFRSMGVKIEFLNEDDSTWEPDETGKGPDRVIVHGRGLQLRAPSGPIDCGNSGTTMRLMSGILAGQNFSSVLTGDESLSKRPMKRVTEPLTLMSATVEGTGPKETPPLTVHGHSSLKPITYTLPMASAQVKSAILLAGLYANGKTTVIEPEVTRNHTETMLRHFRVKTVREGKAISIYGGQVPESCDFHVPGDISSAAFWLVAAAIQPGSELIIKGVGLNQTRTGILKVLIRMGAQIAEDVTTGMDGEPCGTLTIRGGNLKGTIIEGAEIPNVIDELPILAVAAAFAHGKTIIRDAKELRVKETDRISAVVGNLRQFGVDVRELEDGMEIEGSKGEPLSAGKVTSFGDHRIAMAFAIAGLFSNGESVISDVECVNTSYPGFAEHLRLFQSKQVSGSGNTPVIDRPPGALSTTPAASSHS
jgi:3-phosphoshikimate 1-carboxyvinyltransferase